MNDWLDHVIYFVGSGLAFFVGSAFVWLSLLISLVTQTKLASLTRNLSAVIGVILVAISAAPLEWWIYWSMALSMIIWLPLEWSSRFLTRTLQIAARVCVFVVWLFALAMETPYHVVPMLPEIGNSTFFIIGDSVSAGMSDADRNTWPRLFAQQYSVEVVDCSKMGATVKSSRRQAEKLGDKGGLVLLEIGGNDLLGSTTPAQFEEHLDLLLSEVCRDDRTIVMLALPLPPMGNQFGLSQRQLARKHGVILVPQRVLAGLLTGPGATVDGIHLTATGHQRMADVIAELFAATKD